MLVETQSGVAHDRRFFREHRHNETLYRSHTINQELRHTVDGAVVALRNAVQRIVERLAQHEILAKLVARSNDSIELGVLHTVFVDGLTILQQSSRITQRDGGVETHQIVVGLRQSR